LRERLVEEKRRRHQALAARSFETTTLTVQLLRIRLQPGQVSFGVGRVLDGMIGVEEPRDVEISADVLNHYVRRVAPVADRDVAIGQPKPVESRLVCAPNHLDAGPHRVRETRHVERLCAIHVVPDLVGDLPLPFGRSVRELGAQRRPITRVDPQRRGVLRKMAHEVLGNLVEQRERVSFGRLR
jgi:hypothetical protein